MDFTNYITYYILQLTVKKNASRTPNSTTCPGCTNDIFICLARAPQFKTIHAANRRRESNRGGQTSLFRTSTKRGLIH